MSIQQGQPINLLQQFEKMDEAVLNTGDILYVPPGVAHHGISESDDCLTISIGFRSPSAVELMDEILQSHNDKGLASKRFVDQATKQQHPAKFEAHDIEQARILILASLLDDKALIEALGKQLSQKKYPELSMTDATEYSEQLQISSDARVFYYKENDNAFTIFANGEKLSSNVDEAFIQSFIDGESIQVENCSNTELELITQLINLSCVNQ